MEIERLTRQQLIDRQIILQKKIAEIQAALAHDDELKQEGEARRCSPYQRRLMREEAADLKATDARIRSRIAELNRTTDHPAGLYYWFHQVVSEEVPPWQIEAWMDRAREMREALRGTVVAQNSR